MYLQLVVWDLTDADVSVEDLREYLRDYAVEAYSDLPGMRLKVWFANPDRRIWGAVYLWDGAEHMGGPARVSRAIELIGYPPTSVSVFQVEATAEGRSVHETLTALGRAFAVGDAGPDGLTESPDRSAVPEEVRFQDLPHRLSP